jgi:type IV secretion system protein VirB10
VSANNPYQPENPGADEAPGNSYTQQYNQAAAPDLDAAAPQLRTNEGRRSSRNAIFVLGGTVAVLIVGALLLMNGVSHRHDAPAKPREETVNVPPAPSPLPASPAAQPREPAQPIALAPKTSALPLPTAPAEPLTPRGPTLRERRTAGETTAPLSDTAMAGIQGAASRATPPGGVAALADISNAQPLSNPDTLMLRGTFIRCVLQTRVVTDYPGFTSCTVTEPVYSFNGKRLLLPKGSKVLGKYDTEPTTDRVYVVWDRIVTPTGIDVNMASPGVDNLGGSGHPGHYNAHWGSRIGAALLISLLSDAFKYEAAVHGPRQTTISNGVVTQTPFESNTAQTVQNLANQAVQRSANRAATVTINQGTVVSIYVAKDVDFSGVVARF